MEKKTFCLLVLVVLMVFFLASLSLAAAAPAIIKFAHTEPPGELMKSPWQMYGTIFKNIVEDMTQKEFEVQIFGGSQLGDHMSSMEQTSRGIIQIFGGPNPGMLSGFYPNIQVLEIPYSIANLEIGRFVLDGWFGKELSDALAEKSQLRVLSWLPNSFRSFTNSKKEIRTPADMKGLRIRTMEAPVHMAMVKALGASPTPIPWEELYSALQTGVVDGEENPPYTIIMAKLYEVQKFMTMDRHLLHSTTVLINDKYYKGLSPKDRWIIEYAARQAKLAMLGNISAKESLDMATIVNAGVRIYTPKPDEYAQFQKAIKEPTLAVLRQKVEQKWIDKYYKAIAEAEAQTGYLQFLKK